MKKNFAIKKLWYIINYNCIKACTNVDLSDTILQKLNITYTHENEERDREKREFDKRESDKM